MSKHAGFRKTPVATFVRAAIYGLPLLASAQAYAATEALTLDTTEVVEERDSYQVKSTKTATKTDTPLRNIPQSISVVTDKQIKDQNMQSMADVVRYVPGVQMAQGEGHRDAPIMRGIVSTADFYVDGMRDDTQYLRDLYNVERVEVLKGPNGMVFGRGATGGLINRTIKQANWLDRNEIGLTYGSWDKRRITTDFNKGVNEQVAVRLTAMFEDSNSYRDYAELERWGINPTATLRLSDATSIELGYEHFEDDRVVDRGVPAVIDTVSKKGKPLKTNESTFFGGPDQSYSNIEVDAVTARVTHEFNDAVTLVNQTRYADYKKYYVNVYPTGLASNDTEVKLGAYDSATDRTNLLNQTDLTIKAETFGLGHTLLIGGEVGRQVTENLRKTGTVGNVPLSRPVTFAPVTLGKVGQNNKGVAKTAAVYLQDQIEITSQWEAVLGVRYENFKTEFHNYAGKAPVHITETDDLISPRAGLIYKPLDDLSIYASYSLSHQPRAGEQLASLDVNTNSLDPEKFINREVGVKWDIDQRLAATVAVYRLTQTNTPFKVGENYELVDGVEVKGVELGLTGNVTDNWQITGGYAYQESEILGGTMKGFKAPQVPRNSVSIWNRYDFSEHWGIGLGATYQSYVHAALDTTDKYVVILPSYTRVDAAVYYTVNPQLKLQLNVENLLNEEYYASAHNNHNIMPGSPMAMSVSANVTF